MALFSPRFRLLLLAGSWLMFGLVSGPARAETKVHAGEYSLGVNCSVSVERKKDGVYDFFVEQKSPPMHTKVAIDVTRGASVQGPNLCGHRDHPKAKLEVRETADRMAYLLDCSEPFSSAEGRSKLVLNRESGKLELVSVSSSGGGQEFVCVSHGDESMAALEAVEKLRKLVEDRKPNVAGKVSDRQVSGKDSPVGGSSPGGPSRSPAGWFSSPAR